MALEWISYAALGERLGISPEAVRQRAIRHEWSKRTANDGRAEVRVDVEELLAAQAIRLKAEPSADTSPTPERDPVASPADDRAVDVMVASLRELVARADAEAERERVRASDERDRADKERDRADALAAELVKLQADTSKQAATAQAKAVENVEASVAALRALVDKMQQSAGVPTWLRWATGRAGRAS